jgi:hypothetical protein
MRGSGECPVNGSDPDDGSPAAEADPELLDPDTAPTAAATVVEVEVDDVEVDEVDDVEVDDVEVDEVDDVELDDVELDEVDDVEEDDVDDVVVSAEAVQLSPFTSLLAANVIFVFQNLSPLPVGSPHAIPTLYVAAGRTNVPPAAVAVVRPSMLNRLKSKEAMFATAGDGDCVGSATYGDPDVS